MSVDVRQGNLDPKTGTVDTTAAHSVELLYD